ncbi:MAG: acyltransferase family protein [Rikenellaceae bacterium]
MVGVAMWIVILINNKTISNLFTNKVLVALGRSSFSIYMWHTPIIILNYMLLKDCINTWVIIAISVTVTLVVARLSFLYIETPCISLGHRITRK